MLELIFNIRYIKVIYAFATYITLRIPCSTYRCIPTNEDSMHHDSRVQRQDAPRWPSSAIGKSIDHIVAKVESPAMDLIAPGLRQHVIISYGKELIGKRIAAIDSDPGVGIVIASAPFPMPGARAAARGDDFQLLPRENARGRGSRLLPTRRRARSPGVPT